MIRRLVKHGPSTLIVSLPSKWVKRLGLKAKDEINLEDKGESLIVSPKETKINRAIESDITFLDRTSIRLLLHSIYRSGFTKATLHFSKDETKYIRKKEKVLFSKVIRDFINGFIGFEITREGKNSIELSQVSTINKSEIKSIRSRTNFLFQDIVQSFSNAIVNEDFSELSKIEDKHDSITKLISFLIRSLNVEITSENVSRPALVHILASLDKLVDIMKYISREKYRIKNEQLFKTCIEFFKLTCEEYVKLTRKYDVKSIEKISKTRSEMKEAFNKNINKFSSSEAYIISSLIQGIEIIFDLMEWKIFLDLSEEKK